MAEDTRTPTLMEVLEVAVAAGVATLHCFLPARVEQYDSARQVVRAQPMVGSTRVDSNGVEYDELFPAVVEVPVAWPGAGGARLTFPLRQGDFGILVFSDRSLDEWRVNRGTQPMVPNDPRTHSLQDAVFLPGLRPPSNPWGGARTDALTLGYADEAGQGMQVHVTPAGIALGEPTPAYAVALAEKVFEELTTIKNAIFNAVPASGAADGGAGLQTSMKGILTTAGFPHSVASESVKVKG